MAKKVTFIHAADLHLGAPFRGLRAVSGSWADRLLKAIPEAYDRMVDIAISHEVDFVVIAGDIFDMAHPSYADYLRFFEGLQKLGSAGIPVYLCTGNHDPYTTWQSGFADLPPNASMFSADKPSFAVFERDGLPLVLLGGRGYFNQSWPEGSDISDGITRERMEGELGTQAPFAVGVLHTGLDLDCVKAPTDPKKLARADLDYWALGHVHMPWIDDPADPRIVFSGCIQGRAINETGERGVFEVSLTEGRPNRIEFIPTASVVWQKPKVDVSGCASLAEIDEKIMRELFRLNGEAHCEEMIERVTLTGSTALHGKLGREGVLEDVRKHLNDEYPAFFCDALIDRTHEPIDKDALRDAGLFPSVLLAASSAHREDEASSIAYLQEEFIKKNMQVPLSCEKDIEALSRLAEDLVLDLLDGGER